MATTREAQLETSLVASEIREKHLRQENDILNKRFENLRKGAVIAILVLIFTTTVELMAIVAILAS